MFRASSCLVCGRRGRRGAAPSNAACSGNLGIKNPSLFCALDWFHRRLGRGTDGISCFIVRLPLGNLGETRSEEGKGQDKTSSCPTTSPSSATPISPARFCVTTSDSSRSRARKEKAFHASTGTDDNEAMRRVEISGRRVG